MTTDQNLHELSKILAKIHDAGLIEQFLCDIMTESELKDLSSRWEIVKLLEKGVTQRKIAHDLHLSLCKITRGSRELNKKNSAIKKIIQLIN
jgi:TrpR family trp operon transcriptional repressor